MNRPARPGRLILLILVLLMGSTRVLRAQPGTTINLKNAKPAEFAKKLLRSEKTDYGPLSKFRQLMQNTFTRYNYLYNANKRMEDILDKATTDYKEDYARLLTYYPYDTRAMKGNAYLDSVIQHATAGILLHDLRNQYVDELYFLLGKAYYYQQKYDTAYQVFQYLNYAFAPKDDGYDLPVGSNISKVRGNFTIMNPEHKGISKNSYARKDRRNDGLIWEVKNYIQSGDYIQARVLLGYIEKDSLLPDRLRPLVAETHGFLFYRLQQYDSAATYLARTNYTLYNRPVRPRMYYLTGQLFALGGDSLSAAVYYAKAKSGTLDPLLSIYAALAEASMASKEDKINSPAIKNDPSQRHLALLEKLAHRDKYRRYKDVIYFAEASIELNKGQSQTARALLLSSINAGRKITPPNDWQKSRTFFTLASLDYHQNRFYDASRFYDSTRSSDLSGEQDRKLLELRQEPLNKVAAKLDSIYTQDSLQHLAGLPEKERMSFLKDKAREIRKTIQKKEEEKNSDINPAIRRPPGAVASSLFPSSASSGTAIWYFNNQNLKNSGYQLFRQKFGNRPNVDNWQRLSALNGSAGQPVKAGSSHSLLSGFNPDGSLKLDSSNIQPEDLLKGLPLTSAAIQASNDKIASNLFAAGQILQNSMENFTGALYIYDSLMRRFPQWDSTDRVLFNQYICWTLLGKKDQARLVRSTLEQQYKGSNWTRKLTDQDSVQNEIKATSLQNQATYAYNQIYQLFVSGKFAEADSLKQMADKQYGAFYWTPQLLYIESIYHISENRDSVAISKLTYLIRQFSSSPMKAQAQHLLSILNRRTEIEAYLRALKISPNGQILYNRLARLESAAAALADQRERRIGLLRNQKILDLTDTSSQDIRQLSGEIKEQDAVINIKEPDTATINNNNKANNLTQVPANLQQDTLKTRTPLIAQPGTNTAVTPPVAATPRPPAETMKADHTTHENNKDTAQNNPPARIPPAARVSAPTRPTPANQQLAGATIGGFNFNPAAPQYVTVLLHQVAPVFASEAANAFNRYNLLAFEHSKWPVAHSGIKDYDLVQIGPFKDYAAARAYLKQIQAVAASTIVPWLTQDKYEFIIVSPQNTDKLKSGSDLENYQAAWKQFEAK